MNKKKIMIIVMSIVGFLLILFTPIPINTMLDDGSALSLTSLTYKIAIWDMYKDSEKPYTQTEFLIFPKNFNSTEELWEEKYQKIQDDGYGAVTIMVEVTEKYDESIVVTEISSKSSTQNVYSIDKKRFEAVSDDISFDNLTVGTNLTITSNGIILESYPLRFGNIIKIGVVDVKTTIIGNAPQSSSSNTTHTDNNASQEVTSSETSQPERTISSVTDNSSTNDDLSSNSSTQNVYNQKYNHNIFSEQTLIKDIYYDQISGYSLPYTIILPYEYDENIKYPVILYLHGAGYLGSDNSTQYTPIAKTFFYNYKWLNNAIILSPQTAEWWHYDQYGDSGNLNAVMRLFNKITAEYPCDSSRYYVTGGSMGGYGTWQIALNCSDVFAAAMPLCGWWNPSDADKLCDIPIYITHGLADTTVSPQNATEMYDAIIAAGGNKVKIKLYEGIEHDVWKITYTDEEVLDWLFSQKKQ